MKKVSPEDRDSRASKRKRRLRRSSSKYLKPGALAQLRYSKASAGKSCTDLGKKRVAVFGAEKLEEEDIVLENRVIDRSPLMMSPVDVLKQNHLASTPKTPRNVDCEYASRLESLPMELLVLLARQFYFNYTTPDRSRQEMLRIMTPRPTEHWPFVTKGDGKGVFMPSPHTPKAPRQGPRPPRIKITEMKQIAAVLFQDSAFPSRCMVPSVLSRPLCKSLASNRVLFYEDELCQAVAQNKLR
ncbi:hypothetical protein Tsubulata_027302 [Turnera subulata]|uniref:F-box domain-containing protein n=1 Tax=Turnera subulata TaxID=218843 RepID=A0A9Q0G4U8_9ROSI|nr:hypothetical protein Tsubulata_027302 [Turnera subulata]